MLTSSMFVKLLVASGSVILRLDKPLFQRMSRVLFCILVSTATAAPKFPAVPKSWEHIPELPLAPSDPDLVSLVAEDYEAELETVVSLGPHGAVSHIKVGGDGSSSSTTNVDYMAVANRLNVIGQAHNLEYIQDGETVELQSLNAGIEEIRSRFGTLGHCWVIDSATAVTLASVNDPDFNNDEGQNFLANVATSTCILVPVWSDNPAHYTYLQATRPTTTSA